MSVSKISRSLIVAIFTAIIILICVVGIYLNYEDIKNILDISQAIYAILLISFSLLYAGIKEKFSKRRVKKKLSLTYRYTYLIVITFFAKIISIIMNMEYLNTIYILIFSIIGTISGVIIKRIIYNVSKSDMLSVLGMLMFTFLPNIENNEIEYIRSISITLIILFIIAQFQKLIDELKQPNVKTNKYILLSIITGGLIGTSILTGVYSYIFLTLLIIILFITENLDKTTLKFPSKIINKLRQRNKEAIYKLELIYINKKYISVVVIIITAICVFYLLSYVIQIINIPIINNIFINSSTDNILYNMDKNIINSKINIDSLWQGIVNIVKNAKMYYTILSLYIIVIEILTVVLRRRYDTKSTILKTLFIAFVAMGTIFNYNFEVYYLIYTSLFILIAITNTSNLYLNRDERIKLLNS